jgi:hypothetical protein
MVRRACAILLVGLVCLGWSASGATAQVPANCQVGSTPPGYPYEGIEPTSEVLYIGCGSAMGKPVAIIAYAEDFGLCIDVAWRRGSSGACPYGPIEDDGAILVTHAGAPFYPHPGWSSAEGVLRPDVASVSVRFRSRGRARIVPATVAQVTPELAQRLNQPAPFGFFAAFAPGCADGRHIRAKALSASGEILGKDRGRKAPCAFEEVEIAPPAPPPS